jgi:hypothetical protein
MLGRQAPGHLKAIHVREHHVQHHHVRVPPPDQVQRLPASPGRLNPEAAMAKGHRDHIDDSWLIVDDKHTRGFGLIIHAAIMRRKTEKNLGAAARSAPAVALSNRSAST